jgi:hypothetical protein
MKTQSERRNRGVLFLTTIVFVIMLPLAVPTFAQMSGASISGTVTDRSGGVLPNAEVTVKNAATALTRKLVTNPSGFYSAPNLLPGEYVITVSDKGFATQTISGITLAVGTDEVMNVTMQIGQVSENVSVNNDIPAVQLISSSISDGVSPKSIVDLPLNGRDWAQLATLQPGVTSVASLQNASTAGSRGFRGYGAQLTISGTRPQWNDYRLDGISINDFSNSGPGSVTGGTLGVDAIQEFSVSSSNYSAEFGRATGGVISAISRSGSNNLHGDAYEFFRNSALDARNYFDGPKVPTFRRNQFGGRMGGPIYKDRTFFFGDYEGLRQYLGVTQVVTVPSIDARNGLIHNANGTTTNVAVDPLVKPFLAIYPLPTGALLAPGNTGLVPLVNSDITAGNFLTFRVDQRLSQNDSFFASYQFDRSGLTIPDTLHTLLERSSTTRNFITIQESHTFSPSFLNSVRFGFNRFGANLLEQLKGINPVATDTSLGAVPGQNAPAITVPGLSAYGGGLGSITSANFHFNSFQVYDDAFLTRGIHNLKFGFSLERLQDNMFESPAIGGAFTFNSLTGFLTNQPVSFSTGLTSPLNPRDLRQTVLGGYAQDDIRLRSNLTVNVGLRYEMATTINEVENRLQALAHITDATPNLGGPLYSNPTLKNFEPRVGFAWDPFGSGKTSIHGAFGIFDVLPLPYQFELSQVIAFPWNLQETAANLTAGAFPKGAFNSLQLVNVTLSYVDPHPHRNYVMQWNLSAQRELMRNLSLTLNYVGSRGVHNNFIEDNGNLVLPKATSAGYLWPSPIGSGTVLNPAHARINSLSWVGNSFYDALEVKAQKQMNHGFQIQGSYTWGKSIDDGSTGVGTDQFTNSIPNLFPFDRKLRRSVSDFQIEQNLVLNYIWQIPAPKAKTGPLGWAVGGWELGGIFQTRSGLPFTPIIGGDALGQKFSGSTPDFPNRISGPGCGSAVNPGNVRSYINLGCFTLPMATPDIAAQCVPFANATGPGTCRNLLGNAGRNSLVGPGLMALDLSLFKNNYVKSISENFNVQFRAEVFNILNHPNFSLPSNTLYDATGALQANAGTITAANATTSRQIQLALKLIW